jgi:ketosteroid isomerase-like protein
VSESELVQVIHAAYRAYNRGEVDSVLDLLAPDVEWHPPPSSLEPHPLRGRDAVREYLAPNFFESQRAKPLEVIEEGDRILRGAHRSLHAAAPRSEMGSDQPPSSRYSTSACSCSSSSRPS